MITLLERLKLRDQRVWKVQQFERVVLLLHTCLKLTRDSRRVFSLSVHNKRIYKLKATLLLDMPSESVGENIAHFI